MSFHAFDRPIEALDVARIADEAARLSRKDTVHFVQVRPECALFAQFALFFFRHFESNLAQAILLLLVICGANSWHEFFGGSESLARLGLLSVSQWHRVLMSLLRQ